MGILQIPSRVFSAKCVESRPSFGSSGSMVMMVL